MPSSGLLWHWHTELRWRGWRSQCELAEAGSPGTLTPCLTPPLGKCWQTDGRDVKVEEWRRGRERENKGTTERERERETGRKHCVTSGACRFTVCPRLLSRQHAAYSNLHGQPTATFKYYQAICNIQQPLHSKVWIWAKCCEKKGMSKVSLMLRRKKNIIQVFYLGNNI